MKEETKKAKAVRIRNKRNELLILTRNRRSCCICHSSTPVQIHHIDGRPDHGPLDNLAVLCLSHHDQATAGLNPGQVGLGKKLTPEEVRLHKKTWERAVSEETAWKRRLAPQDRRKQSLILFQFELMRVKNEILASHTKEAIENRFGYLRCLSDEFFRSSDSLYRRLLLDAYADLAGRGMGVKPIALCVIDAIENDCSNLDAMNDPKAKLSRTDKWALVLSARILGQVGCRAVIFEKDTEVVARVCDTVTFLLSIAISFEFEQLHTEVEDSLDRMRSEIERLSSKGKASPLIEEHRKHINSVLEKLRFP